MNNERSNHDIDTQAAEWVVRLDSPDVTPEDRARLEAWLSQDPLHEAAFRLASQAWRKVEDLGRANREARAAGPRAVAAFEPANRPGARRRGAVYAAAASLLVAIVAGALFLHPGDAADYRTATGELRLVVLADGSSVHLNTASAIAVRYGRKERRIELIEGEAVFTVVTASDGAGPFVVEADGGTIRALGTEFAVRRDQGAVDVTVIEHSVEVSLKPERAGRPAASAVVSSGESLRYSQGGLGPLVPVRLSHAAAWRDGRLVFDRVPLEDVVAELNRYRSERIVVGDKAMAAREVSGVFRIDDLDGAVEALAGGMRARLTAISAGVWMLH